MKIKTGPKIIFFLLLVGAIIYGVQKYVPRSASAKLQKGSSSASGVVTILTLSGSNTIGSDLVPKLVRAWLQQKGAVGMNIDRVSAEEIHVTGTLDGSPVQVLVNAHGSATAFTDLIAGKTDIGMSSRPIITTEATQLGRITERVIGLDGVAVVVNMSNSLSQATKAQLADLFTSGRMNVYARDDNSGTYDIFRTLVLRGRPLAGSARRFENSQALVAGVASDPNGIGFVSLSAASGVKKLSVSDGDGSLSMSPTETSIRTESYPLSRRLYLYTKDSSSPVAGEFVAFAVSAPGQNIVEETGFVGQKISTIRPAELPGVAITERLGQNKSRLDVDLRFKSGSAELDSKAVDDIDRIIERTQGKGIVLVGFSDSTGSPAANIGLSTNRAQAVADILRSKGVQAAQVTGFGSVNPVASNATPEGRERNRRVEVWVQ